MMLQKMMLFRRKTWNHFLIKRNKIQRLTKINSKPSMNQKKKNSSKKGKNPSVLSLKKNR